MSSDLGEDYWDIEVTAPEGYDVKIFGGQGDDVGPRKQGMPLPGAKSEFFVTVSGLGTLFLTHHGKERPAKQADPERYPRCYTNCQAETAPVEYENYIEVNGSGRHIGYNNKEGRMIVEFYQGGEFVLRNEKSTEAVRDITFNNVQHLGLLEKHMLLMISGKKELIKEWNDKPRAVLAKIGMPPMSLGGMAIPHQVGEYDKLLKTLRFDNDTPLPIDHAHQFRRTGQFAFNANEAQLFGHIKCKLCKVGFAAAAAALLVAVAAAVGVTGGTVLAAAGEIAAFASTVGLSAAVVTPIVEAAAKNLKSFVGDVLEAICSKLGKC